MANRGNISKVILVGNLGHKPELKLTPKGNHYTHLSLATHREVKNAEGEFARETHWHRATVWGKQAENCAKFLTKGSRIYLEGELRMSNWTDKEGQARKSAEIHAHTVTFLGGEKPESRDPESQPLPLAN